jgi:hypothetical protein
VDFPSGIFDSPPGICLGPGVDIVTESIENDRLAALPMNTAR